jgi:hypothetical protein
MDITQFPAHLAGSHLQPEFRPRVLAKEADFGPYWNLPFLF